MVVKISLLSRYNLWWKYDDWEKEDFLLYLDDFWKGYGFHMDRGV